MTVRSLTALAQLITDTLLLPELQPCCPLCSCHLHSVPVAVEQKKVWYRDLPARLSREMLKMQEVVPGCSSGH